MSGESITIPAGFVTDFASIPRSLWSIYSPHDQYSRAAVIHDYLYWTQFCTREQADNLFLIAMKESNVPEGTSKGVYTAVATLGGAAWETNAKERRGGWPRIVPVDRMDFHPNTTWTTYRQQLMAEGRNAAQRQARAQAAGLPQYMHFGPPASELVVAERLRVLVEEAEKARASGYCRLGNSKQVPGPQSVQLGRRAESPPAYKSWPMVFVVRPLTSTK